MARPLRIDDLIKAATDPKYPNRIYTVVELRARLIMLFGERFTLASVRLVLRSALWSGRMKVSRKFGNTYLYRTVTSSP